MANDEKGSGMGGRYWVRTSDLFGVNEARYHCANRPGEHRVHREASPPAEARRNGPRTSDIPPTVQASAVRPDNVAGLRRSSEDVPFCLPSQRRSGEIPRSFGVTSFTLPRYPSDRQRKANRYGHRTRHREPRAHPGAHRRQRAARPRSRLSCATTASTRTPSPRASTPGRHGSAGSSPVSCWRPASTSRPATATSTSGPASTPAAAPSRSSSCPPPTARRSCRPAATT